VTNKHDNGSMVKYLTSKSTLNRHHFNEGLS